jgi:hypothetical protein
MIQILIVAVSVGLIILGVKGFTKGGIPISKSMILQGTAGKVVGVVCILAGVLFIPAFALGLWLYTNVLGN